MLKVNGVPESGLEVPLIEVARHDDAFVVAAIGHQAAIVAGGDHVGSCDCATVST